jgi:gas vesicle protein GvpA/GvpJ/GvpM family
VTPGNTIQPGASAAQSYGGDGLARTSAPANLGDILERVLDKGLVIAGDIQINLLDIELLTIKLRLVIASLDTAREVGINWWETDPWLSADAGRRNGSRKLESGGDRELEEENLRLAKRVRQLEAAAEDDETGGSRRRVTGEPRRRRSRDE